MGSNLLEIIKDSLPTISLSTLSGMIHEPGGRRSLLLLFQAPNHMRDRITFFCPETIGVHYDHHRIARMVAAVSIGAVTTWEAVHSVAARTKLGADPTAATAVVAQEADPTIVGTQAVDSMVIVVTAALAQVVGSTVAVTAVLAQEAGSTAVVVMVALAGPTTVAEV